MFPQVLRIAGRRFCRNFSSSSGSIKCTTKPLEIEPAKREKFQNVKHHKLYTDMSKKGKNVAYAADLYDENDCLLKSYQGRLHFHDDDCSLEMQGSLEAISQVLADEAEDVKRNVKRLLVVTDCKGAYEHFIGEKVIPRSDRARWGRYNKRKTRLALLKSKFEEVAFGRVLRDDSTMERVDNAARVHRESMEK